MVINKKLIPLKAHIFLFFGCMAPILPFILVLAVQLGIPLPLQGTLTAFSLLFTIVGKPLIAGLADAFPSYRKVIFLAILSIMVISFSAIKFIPALQRPFRIRGRLLDEVTFLGNSSYNSSGSSSSMENITNKDDRTKHRIASVNSLNNDQPGVHIEADSSTRQGTESNANLHGQLLLFSDNDKSNSDINSGRKCTFLCDPGHCSHVNSQANATRREDTYFSISVIGYIYGEQISSSHSFEDKGDLLRRIMTQNSIHEYGNFSSNRLYQIEGVQLPNEYSEVEVSILCAGGEFVSEDGSHQRALQSWQFWMLAVLLIAGQMTFNTSVSITDAITVDTTGDDGSYGVQRAWGTIGWGIMAPISGLLVDWWSGNSITKNYTPAFLLCFCLGALDVILSAAYVKVPNIKDESNIWKNLQPLLKESRFFVFCCFVILNGFFDGIVVNFIFIMQEDMAKGTSAVDHMKFLQGLTLLIQSLLEAPFMFAHGWFMKTLGAQKVTSLVFFTYIFRLLGLFVVGKYGSVWATLVPELLNGPCYGLGYTAIVAYAAQITPTGTSNTVQSVVNICYESFGYALAVFLGGFIYNEVGGPYMYLMASGMAVCTLLCHIVSLKRLKPSKGTCETEKCVPSKQELVCIEQEESKSLKSNDDF
ncbi:uncharacterized protein [Palaemon carinicauda]